MAELAGDSDGSRPAAFQTTHWSVVRQAQSRETLAGQEAFDALCRAYWRPVQLFARRLGYPEADASDLAQGFFAQLLHKGSISAADPERGRFRTFLLTAFRNFAHNERDRRHAAKRGGKKEGIAWAEVEAAGERKVDRSELADPVQRMIQDFDRAWAETVFARSLEQLRAEHVATKKVPLFENLSRFISNPADQSVYARAGEPLGLSAKSVAVAVHRLRHRYTDLVRDEVAQTVGSEEDLEGELRYLIEIMAGG